MTQMHTRLLLITAVLAATLPTHAHAQDGTVRDAARARREARREARAAMQGDDPQDRITAAERMRAEGALRTALARAVRERLNLNDQQATRLMEVNRKYGEDRLRLTRDELRIRRDLRQAIAAGDSSRSPETARLLDGLLDVQRQRLELQQKEQTELSEFLTPEQRARYLGMMEQLRRRIQARADSARGGTE